MKVQIETKFNIGDKIQVIHNNRLWQGKIGNIEITSYVNEEVAGIPVAESHEKYFVNIEFSEDSKRYERTYGPFAKDRLIPLGKSIPVCEDENDFKN